MAYERLTGALGQQRDDILAARTAFYVVSALSSSKTNKPKLSDFLPNWGLIREEAGGDDQESADQAGGGR
ncbi:hypothetical protein DP939_02625 [Spongiactinospora rosea]|uniref:Minor tail T domain-containing protein n=1 Tax=Spongiactinospora rosea TaxID=2248750 RepID=A0A366M7P8_9ACTN|nr:DUF4035 domain-containing protein [Spongiactinospora rosea]RBQ21624.1 hypothetical protein DP939_02625 [Spongiactinospora rosea]